MPKRAAGLTARQVQTITRPGLFADGGGLYLQVTATGAKTWIYRFQINDRRREMGLGSVATFTLAEARRRALVARQKVADGIDPIDEKKARKATASIASAKAISFRKCADAYVAAHRAGWKSAVHADQWAKTLEMHVHPTIGDLPVQSIDVGLVLKVLEPIWTKKPETAGRIRGRIEAVLDWATARGHRKGENPARWRGHLENLLPKKSKIHKVEHLAAMPYTEIGTFMADLRRKDGISARALEFAILTAGRNSEVAQAKWDEISINERLWTVPADRMKSGREHRVPLSDAAMAIVEKMNAIRQGEYIFPGRQAGHYLSTMALIMALRGLGRGDLTVHGFRSTFRDWAAERTSFPTEIAEMALSHAVGGAVERAYRRGDLLQKRRQLAEAWGRYCAEPAAVEKIVPLRAAAAAHV